MSNQQKRGNDAREALKNGVDAIYYAVAPTLGARGRNVVYRKYGRPEITNDGVSIARRIDLKDPFESIGADLMKEAAENTNGDAGDGTTTSTVLARKIISAGMRSIDNGSNPMMLRRDIENATEAVLAELDKVAIQITNDDELLNIATISVESKEIAQIVTDAVKKVGKDGIVLVEESSGTSIEKEEVEGMRFEQGYTSPYMVSNMDKMEAVLTDNAFDIPVLVTDKSFNLNNDLFPIVEGLHKSGIDKMLIIAEEISGELLASLIRNRLKNTFHAVVVKRPYNADMLEDIATLVGATAITAEKGIVKVLPEHLGKARKIIVKKDSTTIIDGGGDSAKLKERIDSLRTQVEETEETYIKEKLKERLAKLTGGVAIIRVGASTETEMKYLKLKIDDAVNATKAALEDGIILGGGIALFHIGKNLNMETEGHAIVSLACIEPLNQILLNSGKTREEIDAITTEISEKKGNIGYDAYTDEVCDLIEHGVIDPVKVTKSALKNASSLASMLLTTEVVIADDPEKEVL